MAYQKRIPPIKIRLNTDDFNKLVEIVNIQTENENEIITIVDFSPKSRWLFYLTAFSADNPFVTAQLMLERVFATQTGGYYENHSIHTDLCQPFSGCNLGIPFVRLFFCAQRNRYGRRCRSDPQRDLFHSEHCEANPTKRRRKSEKL